jgi:hypothetical protein
LRSHPLPRQRPNPARLSIILFSFHFGSLVLLLRWENLRQHPVVREQRPTNRSGRTTSRPGIEAGRKWSTPAANTIFRALSAERRRSAQASEDLQKLRRKYSGRQPKNGQSDKPKKPRRNRYSVCTDSGTVALRSFWGMHVEAMNWSGWGMPSMPRRWVCRRIRCGFGAIGWNNPVTKSTGGPRFVCVAPRSLVNGRQCVLK